MQAFQYKIVFAHLPCENNIAYDAPTVWKKEKKAQKNLNQTAESNKETRKHTTL